MNIGLSHGTNNIEITLQAYCSEQEPRAQASGKYDECRTILAACLNPRLLCRNVYQTFRFKVINKAP